MHAHPLRTLALVATSAALALSVTPAQAAQRHHSNAVASKASGLRHDAFQAADWQGSQLTNGRVHNGQFDFDDWGLTVDSALALAAEGNQPDRLKRVEDAIEHNYFANYAASGGNKSAGAFAKTLLAVAVFGANPHKYGGHDVRQQLLNLVTPADAGFEAGRASDDSSFGDFSNTFAQAYTVISLARTGKAPQRAVDYLLKQQCSDGYFRLTEVAGEDCDTSGSSADVDATALAIQALMAADKDGADFPARALNHATSWLVSAQRDNGSFIGGTSTPGPNTNSTGLAAEALSAVGRDKAAAQAGRFVASLQLTRKNADGRAAKDIGAIAYNHDGLKNALKNGIQTVERDQFRRATAQAIFALVPKPLGTLTAR